MQGRKHLARSFNRIMYGCLSVLLGTAVLRDAQDPSNFRTTAFCLVHKKECLTPVGLAQTESESDSDVLRVGVAGNWNWEM